MLEWQLRLNYHLLFLFSFFDYYDLFYQDVVLVYLFQFCCLIIPVMEGDFKTPANVLFVLALQFKWSGQTRGRDFKRVFLTQPLFFVNKALEISTNPSALIQRQAAVAIDKYFQFVVLVELGSDKETILKTLFLEFLC